MQTEHAKLLERRGFLKQALLYLPEGLWKSAKTASLEAAHTLYIQTCTLIGQGSFADAKTRAEELLRFTESAPQNHPVIDRLRTRARQLIVDSGETGYYENTFLGIEKNIIDLECSWAKSGDALNLARTLLVHGNLYRTWKRVPFAEEPTSTYKKYTERAVNVLRIAIEILQSRCKGDDPRKVNLLLHQANSLLMRCVAFNAKEPEHAKKYYLAMLACQSAIGSDILSTETFKDQIGYLKEARRLGEIENVLSDATRQFDSLPKKSVRRLSLFRPQIEFFRETKNIQKVRDLAHEYGELLWLHPHAYQAVYFRQLMSWLGEAAPRITPRTGRLYTTPVLTAIYADGTFVDISVGHEP